MNLFSTTVRAPSETVKRESTRGASASEIDLTKVRRSATAMAGPALSRRPLTGIVPVHNEAGVLEAVLDSIQAQTHPVDELVVVLDRCTDHSAAIAEERGCVTLQVEYGNTASSILAGVHRASHELLVLFDGNTLVPPGYVERLDRTLVERSADLVEWHGGMMALRKATLDRFGPFSTRYLWTLEYFLRVHTLGGTVVRLDGPHVRLKPSPISRSLRYGMDYADLSEIYGLAPYFRMGTKSGWVPDLAAFIGAALEHARCGRLLSSLRRTIAYLPNGSSDRRNQATVWSPK